MKLLRLVASGMLAAGAVHFAPPASAWVKGGVSTWPDGNVPMVFMLGPSPTLSDGLTWNINAQWALEQWNLNMGRVQLSFTTSSSTAGVNGNLINELYFSPTEDGDAWGPNTLAVTLSWYSGTRRVQSDIQFNSTLTWDAYRGPLRYSGTRSVPEFRRVALHEFGHVIGLSHPDGAGQSVPAVMNSTVSNIETLQADDKEGAGSLYGPGIDNPAVTPTITTQPQSRSVEAGTSVTLSVTASGIGPMTYQWRKDAVALTGATAASLAFSPAKVSDTGDYTVVVANSSGAVTSAVARLTVTPPSPPYISSSPFSNLYTEGVTANLDVYATGAGLSYQWRCDGVAIPGATSSRLTLNPIRMWDGGGYDVVVTNVGGSVTSGKAQIQVQGARPPYFVQQPGAVAFRPGSVASLGATVLAATPMRCVWTRDGATVVDDTSPVVSYYTGQPTHAGAYRLRVTNDLGAAELGPVTMTALPARTPILHLKPQDRTIVEGNPLWLTAAARGDPNPTTYVWRRDGVVLPTVTGSNPYLGAVTPAMAGTYSVTATSSAGSTETHSFKVTVLPRVRDVVFTRSPEKLRPLAGESAYLTIQLNDSAGATYRWYKDGVLLPDSNRTSYNVNGVSAAHAGRYLVEADVGGQTYRSEEGGIEIRGAGRPEVTGTSGALTITEGDPQNIGIGIVTESTGSWTVEWFRDGVQVPGASGTSFYSLYSSTASGLYTARLTHGGTSVVSPSIKVVVRPRPLPVITTHPYHLVLQAGEVGSLNVLADWGVNYTWKKNGVAFGGTGSSMITLGPATAATAGDYTVVVGNAGGSVESLVAHVEVQPGEAPIIRRHPPSLRSSGDNSAYMNVEVETTGSASFQWKKNGAALAGQTGSQLNFPSPTAAMAGNYTVVVTNAYGSVESNAGVFEYDGRYGAPVVTRQPQNSAGVIGQVASLTASGWGLPLPTIQWRRNGANIPGATKWKLDIANAQLSDAGTFDAVISNSNGSVTTQAATLTIGIDNGRIVALAARAQVGTGSDVLIPGFFVSGTVPKKLLIRALGPTLTGYGVQGALADPTLEVKALGSTTVIASNDDWTGVGADPTLAAVFTQVGASALATGSKDAAVIATLAPGLYTAVTAGKSGGTGVALMEVFDVDPAAGKLTGISTRAVVGTGSNVLIPGIVVEGPVAKKLLIRVSGPALAAFGVQGTLKDPKLELKNSAGTTIQTSDNWDKSDSAVTSAVATIGLTPFADGSKDSAIVANLSAGLYTIIISGADGGSGVALVEVYEVP